MPKIVDHDQYRKELLLKAFDLFAEYGYGSLSMRQLAKGLDVSTGTLYHYFQSKEDLFLKLMEELAQQDFLEVEMIMATSGSSLKERIEALFDWVEHQEHTFLKQILVGISFYQEQHNSHDLVQNSSTLSTLTNSYRSLSEKYLGCSDPDLVQLIDNLLTGVILNRIYYPDRVSYRKQSQLLGQMLEAYLATRSA